MFLKIGVFKNLPISTGKTIVLESVFNKVADLKEMQMFMFLIEDINLKSVFLLSIKIFLLIFEFVFNVLLVIMLPKKLVRFTSYLLAFR